MGGGGGGACWYDGGDDPYSGSGGVIQRNAIVAPDDCGSGWEPVDDTDDFNYPYPGDDPEFVSFNPNATDCGTFTFTNTTPLWQEAGIKNVKIRVYYFDLATGLKKTVDATLNQVVIGLPLRYSKGTAANIAAKAIDYARENTFYYFKGKGYADAAQVELYFRDQIDKIVREKGGTASRVGTGNSNIIINGEKVAGFFSDPYDC